MSGRATPGGFGLYVHWPFCSAKCPYCDFNSHVSGRIDHARWRRAFLSEIERLARETPGRRLDTIYFGGGTPSLMDPDTVAAVIAAARSAWVEAPDLEITLEANPTSVEADRLAAFREAGVNRVSMGVQALNDRDLQRLGRQHSAAEARRAFDIVRSLFERSSFDLIYARQDQSLGAWQAELAEAIAMAGDHLSLYQLTIEEGTVFGRRFAAGQLRGLPGETLSADLYAATVDICAGHGFQAYEVSNFARGDGRSRHNLIYWRGGDYLGIGPGAHGRLRLDGRRVATSTPLQPAEWLDRVDGAGSGELPRETLSADEWADEILVMGLRTDEGIDLDQMRHDTGAGLDRQVLQSEQFSELCAVADGRLRLNRQGRMVLNRLLPELSAALSWPSRR
jgi:putative oxygen-independent coproporphyrinogen III oxidase